MTQSASAHPNAVDFSPSSGCNTFQQTAWAAYDSYASSYSGFEGDTIHATMVFQAHGCHSQNAYSGFYSITNANGINGLAGGNVFGVGTIYAGSSSQTYVSANFTIQSPAAENGTAHCFSYTGTGSYFASNIVTPFPDVRISNQGTFCFTVQSNGPKPQVETGTIYISKYGPGHPNADANFGGNTLEVNQASTATQIYQGFFAGFPTLGQPRTNNPNISKVAYQQLGGDFYKVNVQVPPGYRLNASKPATTRGINRVSDISCTGDNFTGSCTIPLVILTASQNFAFVDFFFDFLDIPPIGKLESINCDANSPIITTGWALDMSSPNSSIPVAIYLGNSTAPIDPSPGQTQILTSVLRPDVNAAIFPPTKLIAVRGNHGFSYQLPDSYKDGQQHYVYAYAIGVGTNGNVSNPTNNVFIGSLPFNCQPIPKFYPWLQTKKGDVVAKDKVVGQDFNPGPDNLPRPGARNNTFFGAELEYLLLSWANNRQTHNFCSDNQYVLGGLQPSKQCSAGGYNFVLPNFGNIRTAVNNAWTRNGSGGGGGGSCTPYKSSGAAIPSGDISPGCDGGTIYQPGNGNKNLSTILSNPVVDVNVIRGRATVWIKGNLTIDKNIINQYSGTAGNVAPNLAFFVEGDVEISPSVAQVDAIIIATGRIKTCQGYPSATCKQKLISNGYWASPTGFQFGRNFFDVAAPNQNPAEQIILTGQSVVYPPPGLSRSDGDINSELKFDSGELPPRLK